ncbi:30S ribosomal protein S1 [Hanamia caeni]|jgi:small subunit ribosomal protein S1|uniref:30S ribosomal protein S1 n=1 Tax=Hanamia caeni TaxID=2294116 RepID=UPI001F1A1799|nr:30S ribosomal protein S1 [Hanamia caeni]
MDTENKEPKSETQEIVSDGRPQGGIEGVPFPDFPDVESAQAATEPQPTELEIHEEALSTPHDDFDWSIDKRNVTVYNDSEREKYDEVYDKTFKQINDGEMVTGNVVAMTKTDVVINIGFKSDGLVGLNEFRDMPNLKVGDEVEVMVAEKEDKDGNLHLSRKQARTTRAWEKIVEMHKTGEIVTGLVTSKTKGGLIVDVFGMETFLPGSQIDVKPVTDYDQFVGKTMEFKVVKINEAIKNAVVSHKALIESDIEQQRAEIIGKLEKGQVLEGTIKNITDFGAFLDLGGLDGLLYITDISWGRINHPSEVLKLDQKLNVVVLDFDDDKKRISLGLKQLTPHPWDTLPENIKEGEIVKGKVVNIEDYGAFLEIYPGVEGLVHVSEITWANTPINAKEFFKLGDEYEAKIVTLSKEDRKMSLSIKQMTEDPWNTIETQYPEGSKHKGLVKNITPYGVFVELSPGIGGMIHISDLSWLKRFNNPNEYTKVGENIDVIIMSIDKENRKLQLGHKQIEEDPWNSLEETFPVGSVHEGTVTRRDDKGAIVQLPYGLEGFAPARHLRKEDEKVIGLDEIAPFMVIEFDRNDKKIILSHSRIWEKERADEKNAQLHERRVAAESTKKAVKNIQSKVEKTTLGDLGVLADLKKKMDQAPEAEAEVKAKADEAPAEAPVAKKETSKSKADAEETSNEEEKPKAEKKAEGTLAQTPPPPANEPQHIKAQAEAAAEKEEAEAEDAQDEDASEEEKA